MKAAHSLAFNRRVRCRAAAFGALLFCCVSASGAEAAALAVSEIENAEYIRDTWQTEAGLPHNSVTAVLQTSDGYLWVGTANGLARFDGVRFTIFRTVDSPGLESNRILCLYEDAQGFLWVGTDGGGVAQYRNGEFRSVTTSQGLASDSVLCLGQDSAGEFWVGTASGLDRRADAQAGSFLEVDDLSKAKVYAICQLRGGPVLFGTQNGLCRLSGERLRPYTPPGLPPLEGEIYCLRQDRSGGLWLGGEPGLFRIHGLGTTGSVASVKISSAKVLTLSEGKAGEIWFGTDDGTLHRVSQSVSASLDAGEPLVCEPAWRFPSPVSALCGDHEENLWIGTVGSGLQRLKARSLRWAPFSEGLAETRVACVFEAAGGERWLVAGDQELYRCHNGKFTWIERLPLPSGAQVQSACVARNGGLWFGTMGEGLFEYCNGALNQFSERDGLSDSAIKALCADGEGLWLGTRNGGLNYLKDRKVTRFNTPWGFTGMFACALALDVQGHLWIGTSGDGLYQLSHGRFTGYTEARSLPSGYIHALCADADGIVWVGTSKGLARVKGGQVTAFTGANGLGEEAILQLHGDGEGNLWVGSSSRIFRVRKDQLQAYAEGRVRSLDVVPYGREDGLPGIQCMPQVHSESWQNGRGGVWFFTTKGLVEAQPGLTWNLSPPPVVLESVWVENESVPFQGLVRVAPGKENLRFQYTALSLTAPGKVAFRYRLEGFDRDWSEANPSHTARYPKVPAGRYRFQVVACNNDGLWNETGASAAIVVAPFWWATVWFRAGSVAAGIGLFAVLYRMRRVRRQEIERLRLRIAGDLHDDVGSSLWSITLLSRMLSRQGTLGAEERQDVEEIHRIAVQTSNSIRDIIWLINPAFDTLQDLVLRLKDFAGTALRGSDFKLHCESPILMRRLPLDFRQHLFFFLKEAITNAAKHARAKNVEVRLAEAGDGWRFSIQDDGVGFDPAAVTSGNGLKSLRGRATRMGATLQIKSEPGQGTTIVLATARA